jgi:Phosphoesterase family
VSGSAQQQLNNFMSPPQYLYWPEQPHRASIWKTLWANGITDWTIYNSTEWQNHVFTYELFLQGQIPTVDADVAAGLLDYVAPVQQFYQQALAGTLPAFSYIEPIWIGLAGTTSYHPGEDLVPGEVQLNLIYDSLRKGPNWDETLLIITFDEHGGIFDHVAPPRAVNPWPQDEVDGFKYDVMGVRVPTIIASPWVEPQTVFRSTTNVAYDGTSFMATLLQWFGIPRERWFLGERLNNAPSFESVLTLDAARTDSPAFKPPYDNAYPPKGAPAPTGSVHDLHLHVAHVLIGAMLRGKVSAAEAAKLSHEVARGAKDIYTLTRRLESLNKQYR